MAISFENMVYEDALTILSYASPYPVKITLQKEQQIPRNRRLSDIRTNLNHPLYRSQSVDALNGIPNENELSISKRSASAMRYDKRDSPQIKRTSKRSAMGYDIVEETRQSVGNDDVFEHSPTVSKVDALVHRENESSGKPSLDQDTPQVPEPETSNEGGDNNTHVHSNHGHDFNDTHIAVNSEFSDVFKNLTEQDKLDVLRLSYADPDAIPDAPFETEIQAAEASEQKTVPVKPERKKKRSSTNSTPSQSDGEFVSSPTLTPKGITIDDEVITQELLPPTEAPPPIPVEAEEEIIQPETKSRNVNIDSGNITFEFTTPSKFDKSDLSESDRTLVDSSFLDDADTTLVAKSPDSRQTDSPVDDLVQEDIIAPTQVVKENSVPVNSKIFSETLHNESKYLVDETVQQTRDDVVEKEGDFDFEKGIPSLDMNLNFDADSILFQDTFPNRNTKATENGMAYDISVTELESMEEKAREDQVSKLESRGRGGIAFEVRDDFVNGEPRTINTNSVHRTASYDIRSTHDRFIEHEISSHRPTSLKGEVKQTESGTLEWSGKRLVRAGSFTDIPQDDPVRDWTNRQNLDDDDDLFEKRIKEDSKSPVLSPVRDGSLHANMKDDSDSDSQCRSLSSSTSGDDIPTRTNGEDDGLGISPDNSPVKISPLADIKSDLISTEPGYNDSEKQITVELNAALDNDMDC